MAAASRESGRISSPYPQAEWRELVEANDAAPADWRNSVRGSGYPTPALELPDNDAQALWFDGYVRTYLERDLQSLSAVDNLLDFRRLMRAACHRLGGLVNQTEIARDTTIPRATVQRHLNLLEASYQVLRLPAYAFNRTKRTVEGPQALLERPCAGHLARRHNGSDRRTLGEPDPARPARLARRPGAST